MKIKHFRLLPLLAAGLLSCQDQASNTTAPIEPGSVALTARLTTTTGDSIPAVDSIRFKVRIAQKDTDLVVPWAAHKLDLGTAKLGDSIHWQVTGWKWNATKTQRSILWTTVPHDTLVGVGGTKTTFTLATPIVGQNYALPALTTTAFTVGTLDTVAVPSGTGSFAFAFTVPATDSVWINDTLQVGTVGSYSKSVTIAAGTSVPVKLVLKDTLGAITIRTFTLKRPAATPPAQVDSGSTATFTTPAVARVLIGNGITFQDVEVRTAVNDSTLKVDSVLLNGVRMISTDKVHWTGQVTGLPVAQDYSVTATPYVGRRKGTEASVILRQKGVMPAVPVFIVDSGTYTDLKAVTITCSTPNAVVQWSRDKSSWQTLASGATVTVDTPQTLYARAFGAGLDTSYSQARYVIVAKAPTFSVASGTYDTLQSVAITKGDSRAIVRYTTDGGTTWKTYSGAIAVSKPTILWAYDSVPGLANSVVVRDTVIIRAAIPAFSIKGGTYDSILSVTIGSASVDSGAKIECSFDSSAATWTACASGAAVSVSVSDTLYARATGGGYVTNKVSSVAYLLRVPQPALKDTIRFNDSVFATCARTGVQFEASRDSITWALTPARFSVSTSGPLFVRATKAGWLSSLPAKLTILLAKSGNFKDSRDGTSYKWVRIGTQVWMAENLKYAVDSSWCYGGISSNCYEYGRLYQWSAAMGLSASNNSVSSGVSGLIQGACPVGWHIPRNDEWKRLTDTVLDVETAGTKLKAGGYDTTWYWYAALNIPRGSNDSGFTALPGGVRFVQGQFDDKSKYGYFWSASESAGEATYLSLSYSIERAVVAQRNKLTGNSIRCLLD